MLPLRFGAIALGSAAQQAEEAVSCLSGCLFCQRQPHQYCSNPKSLSTTSHQGCLMASKHPRDVRSAEFSEIPLTIEQSLFRKLVLLGEDHHLPVRDVQKILRTRVETRSQELTWWPKCNQWGQYKIDCGSRSRTSVTPWRWHNKTTE